MSYFLAESSWFDLKGVTQTDAAFIYSGSRMCWSLLFGDLGARKQTKWRMRFKTVPVISLSLLFCLGSGVDGVQCLVGPSTRSEQGLYDTALWSQEIHTDLRSLISIMSDPITRQLSVQLWIPPRGCTRNLISPTKLRDDRGEEDEVKETCCSLC